MWKYQSTIQLLNLTQEELSMSVNEYLKEKPHLLKKKIKSLNPNKFYCLNNYGIFFIGKFGYDEENSKVIITDEYYLTTQAIHKMKTYELDDNNINGKFYEIEESDLTELDELYRNNISLKDKIAEILSDENNYTKAHLSGILYPYSKEVFYAIDKDSLLSKIENSKNKNLTMRDIRKEMDKEYEKYLDQCETIYQNNKKLDGCIFLDKDEEEDKLTVYIPAKLISESYEGDIAWLTEDGATFNFVYSFLTLNKGKYDYYVLSDNEKISEVKHDFRRCQSAILNLYNKLNEKYTIESNFI